MAPKPIRLLLRTSTYPSEDWIESIVKQAIEDANVSVEWLTASETQSVAAEVVVEIVETGDAFEMLFSLHGDQLARHIYAIRGTVSSMKAVARLSDLLSALSRAIPDSVREWERSSEELIRLLYNLLDDRDALTEALLKVYGDLRAAHARIEVLEGTLKSLEAERLRTPVEHRSKIAIGTIAMVIATVLGPIAAVVYQQEIYDDTKKVTAQALKVQNDCNVTVNVDPARAEP